MPSTSANNWYRDADITNHFNIDESLYFDGTRTRIRGLGFLGYLSVGKPWQTLSFSGTNNPAGQEDWKIADYVYAGEELFSSNEIAHVNMGAGQYGPVGARGAWPGNFSRDASVNAHAANLNTWKAVLEGVPLPGGVSVNDLAGAMITTPPTAPYSSALGFLSNPAIASLWADPALNDFEREKTVRYVADMLTVRSRNFTIYAMGQSLRSQGQGKVRPVARTLFLCRVRVGLDTDPGSTGEEGGVKLETLQTAPY